MVKPWSEWLNMLMVFELLKPEGVETEIVVKDYSEKHFATDLVDLRSNVTKN